MSAAQTIAQAHKGLTADVPRTAGPDCSAKGVSSRYDQVVVTGVRVRSGEGDVAHRAAGRGQGRLPRIFGANERIAEVELVVRNLSGGLYVHAEPVEGQGRWAMFGGAYVTTSDSRFGEMLRAIYGDSARRQVGPIPLHDRYES